jgi:hypothetical protein
MDRYDIVRAYQDSGKSNRVLQRNVSEATAQAHCNDPESSSKTCTTSTGKARTRRSGPWFDFYRRR